MDESIDFLQEIDGRAGFWIGPLLAASDLADIYDLIAGQFLNRIRELAPASAQRFAEQGIANYHLISGEIDHATTWTRPSRRFSADAVERVRKSALFAALEDSFGEVEITAEEIGAGPEIQWRLVRPGRPEDLAPIHADQWYWELNDWPVPDGKRRLKVWTMIGGESGSSGLKLYPGSHRIVSWPYRAEGRHGLTKPVFEPGDIDIPEAVPETAPGTSLVFDYGLVHGGALNRGSTCRVSFEFTIFVPDRRG